MLPWQSPQVRKVMPGGSVWVWDLEGRASFIKVSHLGVRVAPGVLVGEVTLTTVEPAFLCPH